MTFQDHFLLGAHLLFVRCVVVGERSVELAERLLGTPVGKQIIDLRQEFVSACSLDGPVGYEFFFSFQYLFHHHIGLWSGKLA